MDNINKYEDILDMGNRLMMVKRTIDNFHINIKLALNERICLYKILRRSIDTSVIRYLFGIYNGPFPLLDEFSHGIYVNPEHHYIRNTDYSYYFKTIGVTKEDIPKNISENASAIRDYELNTNVKVKVPIRVIKLWLLENNRNDYLIYDSLINSHTQDNPPLSINHIIKNRYVTQEYEYKEYDIDDVTKLSDLLSKVLGEYYTADHVVYSCLDAPIIVNGVNIYKKYFKYDLPNDEEFKRGDFFRYNLFSIETRRPMYGRLLYVYLSFQIIDNTIYFMFTNIYQLAASYIKGIYYNNNIYDPKMTYTKRPSIKRIFNNITTVFDIFRLAWTMSLMNGYMPIQCPNEHLYYLADKTDKEKLAGELKYKMQKHINEFCKLDVYKYHIPQEIENQNSKDGIKQM